MTVYSRVYDTYPQAEQAVLNLEEIGVPAADISLLSNKNISGQHASVVETSVTQASATESGAGIGATLGGGAGLLAGLGVISIPGLGPVVAAGWLASTALGAVAGSVTGGIIGALVDSGTSEQDANVYSEAVRRGGTLVTVNTESHSDKIDAVLDGYQPINAAQRRREYEDAGWTKFDADEVEAEPDTPANRSYS